MFFGCCAQAAYSSSFLAYLFLNFSHLLRRPLNHGFISQQLLPRTLTLASSSILAGGVLEPKFARISYVEASAVSDSGQNPFFYFFSSQKSTRVSTFTEGQAMKLKQQCLSSLRLLGCGSTKHCPQSQMSPATEMSVLGELPQEVLFTLIIMVESGQYRSYAHTRFWGGFTKMHSNYEQSWIRKQGLYFRRKSSCSFSSVLFINIYLHV